MSPQLDEIARLIERLRRSLATPGVAIPGNAALSAAIDQLGRLTDKATPYPELKMAIDRENVVLSLRMAELMETLLAQARQSVATDPGKQRALAYQPNRIPAEERWNNFFAAFALLAYGAVSLYLDDFFLPSKRGNGIHIHGFPVLVMFVAVICATVVLLLTLIDHYDRRDNERHYQITAKYFRAAGWTLFGLSLLIHVAGNIGFRLT